LNVKGQYRKVTGVTSLQRAEIVYNFEVEGNHDYYAGGAGILVHNAAKCGDVSMLGGKDSALEEAFDRWGADPETIDIEPKWGKNPNLTGPNGEPWNEVHALDSDAEIVDIPDHANGHAFPDGTTEGPHFHGPGGEHIFY
jgi:hypothetical protein